MKRPVWHFLHRLSRIKLMELFLGNGFPKKMPFVFGSIKKSSLKSCSAIENSGWIWPRTDVRCLEANIKLVTSVGCEMIAVVADVDFRSS